MEWRIHHASVTASTNQDARSGRPGDVYTADYQTAGRGRLDHKWLSAPGENLMMSAVLSVEGVSADRAATLPLVVGLAVAEALESFLPEGAGSPRMKLKWPNDVLVDGRKICGILCERHGDVVVAGVGVNVNQRRFAPEIAERATSLSILTGAPGRLSPDDVRDGILRSLSGRHGIWRERGLQALMDALSSRDFLKGRRVCVRQTDEDALPASGLCGGISCDGSLLVGESRIWAGEAHVLSME